MMCSTDQSTADPLDVARRFAAPDV